jgi:hypothetical protein
MNKNWAPATQVIVKEMAWAENVTIRNGKPRTREYKLVQRALLPKGLVQGSGYFSRDSGQFIVSIWGQMHRILINANNVEVDEIPLEFRNSSLRTQAWMCETAGSFLIQDGESACIIYDGSTARRADPFANEVPLGRQMAYGNGRLCVAVNGSWVVVGDITTPVFGSELLFTETEYLNGGGAFLFSRPITALAFLPVNNTFSGYGSLLVFGEKFVNSLAMQVTARDRWAEIDGFEQVVLPNIGSCAQDVVIGVNQDLYFRDPFGEVWSVRSASSDQGSPGNAPLSREIARVVDYETDTSIPLSSAIYFDGRMMFLANPFNNRFGSASFKSIISLDAAPLASMRGKAQPAYDGVATGLNFQRLMVGQIAGQSRAFVISTDDNGGNTLWEIVKSAEDDAYFDEDLVLTSSPVTGYTESRLEDFGNPGKLKQIVRCDIWPTDIRGEVTITVYWRADSRTQWQLWDTFTVCADMDNADNEWKDLAAQERSRVKTLTAPQTNDAIDNLQTDVGFEFQVRIVKTGDCLINRVKLWARTDLDEPAYADRPLDADCQQNVVVNNNVSYSIPVQEIGTPYVNQDGVPYVDSFGVPYYQPI